MKRIATIFDGDKVVGIIDGPDAENQHVTVNGREWFFDYDEHCGPLWLKRDGSARKNQMPHKRVWNAFDKWLKAWSTK